VEQTHFGVYGYRWIVLLPSSSGQLVVREDPELYTTRRRSKPFTEAHV
jgi:hypothetical protein